MPEVLKHLEVPPVWQSEFLEVLGDGSIADMAMLAPTLLDAIIDELKHTETDEAKTVTRVPILMRGRLGLVGRYCRLIVGREVIAAPSSSSGEAPNAQFVSLGPAPPVKAIRIKLSQVINQSSDADVEPLTAKEKQDAFDNYQATQGGEPRESVEPTEDQLGGLAALVKEGKPPYADFAVFGPDSVVKAKTGKLRGMRPMPDGTWVQVELAGPGTHEAWKDCYKMYRAAVIMFVVAGAETAERYLDHIE